MTLEQYYLMTTPYCYDDAVLGRVCKDLSLWEKMQGYDTTWFMHGESITNFEQNRQKRYGIKKPSVGLPRYAYIIIAVIIAAILIHYFIINRK